MTIERGTAYIHTGRNPLHANLPDGTMLVITPDGYERRARRRFTPGMKHFSFAWKTIATIECDSPQFASSYHLPIGGTR